MSFCLVSDSAKRCKKNQARGQETPVEGRAELLTSQIWKYLKGKSRKGKNLGLCFLPYRFPSVLFLGPAHAPAWLEVGSDTFSWSLVKLRKLTITCIKYRLYLVFGLLRNGHHSVQVSSTNSLTNIWDENKQNGFKVVKWQEEHTHHPKGYAFHLSDPVLVSPLTLKAFSLSGS